MPHGCCIETRQDRGPLIASPNASSLRERLSPLLIVSALFALLAFQLLLPPAMGLADQGDFSRLWQWFGIEAPVESNVPRHFQYLILEWRIDPSKATAGPFLASDLLFVAASVPLNALIAEPGTYDMRALAAVRIAFAAFAAWLLLTAAARGGRSMLAIAAFALLVMFADGAYVAYFNSAYTEPGSLLFGLLAVACFARLASDVGHRRLNLAGFVVASALLLWSKPQNVVLVAPLAFLAWRAAAAGDTRLWRTACIAASVAIVAIGLAYRSLPPPIWYKQQIRHIAVFNSLLLESPDAAADLREIGADASLASLVGKFPWSPESIRREGELKAGFHDRVGDGDIARFYLRHPQRMLPLAKSAAAQSLDVRVGLGHFEADAGRGPYARPAPYVPRSEFIERYGPTRFRWVVGLLLCAVVVAAASWRTARTSTQRLFAEAIVAVAAGAVLQYLLVAVLQGPTGIAKGMLMFAFLYDTAIVGAVALIVHRVWGRPGASS